MVEDYGCSETVSRFGWNNGTIDQSREQNFSVTVWPVAQPEANGTLYDLDGGARDFYAPGQSFFTVRVSEFATETGFQFDEPNHEWECVDLLDTNWGNFTTGYRQWLFQAKDDQLTCNETVEIVHSMNSATPGAIENVTITVDKAPCAYAQCPAGEVQDAYFCGCVAAPVEEGIIYDFDLDERNRVARVRVGEFFTMRESANTTDGRTYTWELPESFNLSCVQEVSRDDTGYYRQVVFEAMEGNCSHSANRTAVGDISVNQTIEWRVYPTEDPPRTGTVFDMDLDTDRDIELKKNTYLTVRMNEAATDHGYAWIEPVHEFNCVTMVNDNFGDFITGYKNWVFLANDVSSHCTDTVTV